MRGRSRNKGPNPLTRSYESNGPDVKIRGTAQHVADKYSQLARDAQASGDPVAAENYFQHAEHYYRLIAAAQEQYRQQYGIPQGEDGEEGDEEAGFGGQGDEFGDVPNFPQGGQGGYDSNRQGQQRFDRNQNQNRQQRFDRNNDRYDRQDRQERGGQDRPQHDRPYQDRQAQGGQNGWDRANGEGRYDRQNGYDRQDNRQQDNRQQESRQDNRQDGRQDRPDRRERFARDDRPREERGNREGYQPREPRQDRQDRAERPSRAPAYGSEPQGEEEQGPNLPAFLTNPVRTPISVDEVAESAGLTPMPSEPAAAEEVETTGIRPRRRRTRKADAAPAPVDETADGA